MTREGGSVEMTYHPDPTRDLACRDQKQVSETRMIDG